MQRLTDMIAAGLVAAVLAGCQSPTPPVDTVGATEPVPILRAHQGSDAALDLAGAWVLNSQAEMAELGSVQLSALPVDFERESLLLLALGQQPTAGYELAITGASRLGDRLFVQGLTSRPAPDAITAQVLTYPYAAAVIAKCDPAVIHPEVE